MIDTEENEEIEECEIQTEELDMSGLEVEAADGGELELNDGDGLGDADTEAGVAPFDPMDLSPKMREMHEGLSLKAQVESVLFASPKPVRPSDLVDLVSHPALQKDIEAIISELQDEYNTRGGGFTLEYVKGLGFQFQSVALAAPMMERLFATRPRPLSRAALETVSIVAYRQPCTRAAVDFIRGVDSGSIMKGLLERDLIKCVGRKEDAGRPMLFGTTDEFLHVFGLSSLKDLPPLQAFQPTSETMQQALQELDEIDEVDIEEFVGDDTEVMPEVSDGLSQHEGHDLPEEAEPITAEAGSVGEELAEEVPSQSDEETIEASSVDAKIEGAVRADDEFEDEESTRGSEDSEVDVSDGDILSAGSGGHDPRGTNLG